MRILLLFFGLFFLTGVSVLDGTMPIKEGVQGRLHALAQQDHFAADGMLYTGVQDPVQRKRLNAQVFLSIQKFKVAYQNNASKQAYLTLLASEIATYPRADTEDAERVAMVFEKMMDCVGLESSNGILNTWMYGFDPDSP